MTLGTGLHRPGVAADGQAHARARLRRTGDGRGDLGGVDGVVGRHHVDRRQARRDRVDRDDTRLHVGDVARRIGGGHGHRLLALAHRREVGGREGVAPGAERVRFQRALHVGEGQGHARIRLGGAGDHRRGLFSRIDAVITGHRHDRRRCGCERVDRDVGARCRGTGVARLIGVGGRERDRVRRPLDAHLGRERPGPDQAGGIDRQGRQRATLDLQVLRRIEADHPLGEGDGNLCRFARLQGRVGNREGRGRPLRVDQRRQLGEAVHQRRPLAGQVLDELLCAQRRQHPGVEPQQLEIGLGDRLPASRSLRDHLHDRVGQTLQLGDVVDITRRLAVQHVTEQRRALYRQLRQPERPVPGQCRQRLGIARLAIGGREHGAVAVDDRLHLRRGVGDRLRQRRDGAVDRLQIRRGHAADTRGLVVIGRGFRGLIGAVVLADHTHRVGDRLCGLGRQRLQRLQGRQVLRIGAPDRELHGRHGVGVDPGHAQELQLVERRRLALGRTDDNRGHGIGQRLEFGNRVDLVHGQSVDDIAQQRRRRRRPDTRQAQRAEICGHRRRGRIAGRPVSRRQDARIGIDDRLHLQAGVGRLLGQTRHGAVHRAELRIGDTDDARGLVGQAQGRGVRAVVAADDFQGLLGRLGRLADELGHRVELTQAGAVVRAVGDRALRDVEVGLVDALDAQALQIRQAGRRTAGGRLEQDLDRLRQSLDVVEIADLLARHAVDDVAEEILLEAGVDGRQADGLQHVATGEAIDVATLAIGGVEHLAVGVEPALEFCHRDPGLVGQAGDERVQRCQIGLGGAGQVDAGGGVGRQRGDYGILAAVVVADRLQGPHGGLADEDDLLLRQLLLGQAGVLEQRIIARRIADRGVTQKDLTGRDADPVRIRPARFDDVAEGQRVRRWRARLRGDEGGQDLDAAELELELRRSGDDDRLREVHRGREGVTRLELRFVCREAEVQHLRGQGVDTELDVLRLGRM